VDEAPWPFLAVLTSATPAVAKGDAPEPARVRGLGLLSGDAAITLAHVAQAADRILLPDGGSVQILSRSVPPDGLAVVQLGVSGTAAMDVRDVSPGQPVTVAIVSDYGPNVRLVAGRAGAPGSNGSFTVELDGRLGEDETASGSPVVGDGVVVGIVGPTATNASVDAFGAAALREALPAAAPSARSPEYDLAGGVSADLVDPTKGIPLERDSLNLGVDVTMFAALIADATTPMPLSIGLFGEWGSGKSYFMGLLRNRIAELAASPDPRYHREIVQIGFNAWHYADSNLWASLGDEIFEQLAGPQGDDVDARRSELRSALTDLLQRRQELRAAADQAQAETARLTTQLDGAASDRRVSARELAVAVLEAPELRKQLEPAFKRLGVGEGEKADLLADELQGVPEDVSVVRTGVAGVPRWTWIAGVVLVALVVAGVALAWDTAAGIVAAVPAVLAVIGAVLARMRSGARVLHEVAESIRRGHEERVAEHLKRLKSAETNERVLQTQLDGVIEQAGELGRELAELTPGRRLYSFVVERAASDAYRGQLGLISTIRKDFEQLILLMQRWRDEGGAERDGARRPIDRIVLYIDDLDRCSPEQVIEVLQAVHLLLALDLFVVVVGVDPRWLLHSLRREYRTLLTMRRRPSDDDPRWETTPQDYLEKIFNIPFLLPGMTPTSFRKLIGSFAETEAAPALAGPDGTTDEASPREPAPASTPAETGSEVVQLQEGAATVERRPLTQPELDMLSALAPLVDTPREAKRLMNLYRMMRSTRDLSPVSRFLGDEGTPGEYQAVVILLGLLSGHARLLHDVLAGLRARPQSGTWAAFAADLQPHSKGGGVANDVVGPIADSDVEQWRKLADGLRDVSALVTLPDLTAFQLWAPRIARFSFLLSPYVESSRGGARRGAMEPPPPAPR
jgi:hypothetical protein